MTDIVLEKMKHLHIPLTLDNYLDMAYMGDPPKELTAEEEADIPEEIQRPQSE
jgi:hypothetical protein